MARQHLSRVSFLTEFAKADVEVEEQAEETFSLPEDLGTLSDEDLTALSEKATSAFSDLYGDGHGLTDDDMETLGVLTQGIKALAAESTKRAEADSQRAEQAAALAADAGIEFSAETATDEAEETDEEEETATDEAETPETDAAETVTASGHSTRTVSLSRARSRRPKAPAVAKTSPLGIKDIMSLADSGEAADYKDIAAVIDRRLAGFNQARYVAAAERGQHIMEQKPLAKISRNFSDDVRIQTSDPEHVAQVFANAIDQSRLSGGSLVASGGWGAPSETVYDIMSELETTDGLVSIPEVGVNRGGLRYTLGPDFATLFADITGFHYTEAQDIAGNYAVDADGIGTGAAGNKPVYTIPIPSFTDTRLETDGYALKAGLLAARGFPEAIARVMRGAVKVRAHRTSGMVLDAMETGSTAVTMTASQVGATAPILDAIEMQVNHFRTIHRLARNATLEAVFPSWVFGAIRTDLSRRLGLVEFEVTDERITSWFRMRGISAQFVYNWHGLSGAADAFLTWPTSVTFLLYTPGCWVKGTDDVLTIDTLYDSSLLENNDFTALWTEDAWFVARMHHDSRAVTVGIEPDGSTHAGILIEADGTETPSV